MEERRVEGRVLRRGGRREVERDIRSSNITTIQMEMTDC